MPKTSASTPAAELTFEQAMDELDALVRRMEAGELSLDESIAAYRRGAARARPCQPQRNAAEREIRQREGAPLQPLDPAELRGAER